MYTCTGKKEYMYQVSQYIQVYSDNFYMKMEISTCLGMLILSSEILLSQLFTVESHEEFA